MRILLIADLHIGSIKDINYFYNTTTDIIDNEIMTKKTDLVVFLGDYFDKLFKNNEDFTALAINIMSYLVLACLRSKTKIRMIYGTESHEMNQYRLFNFHLLAKNIDMKIIETVTEEEIDGKKILYIPEEYIDDKHKHYRKYLYSDKHYDFIFGHGVIEDGMPEAVSYTNNKSTKEKRVPHFKSGEFAPIADITVFGHYHQYNHICDHVYYLGSLFRDSFGEEIDKGYGVISDTRDDVCNSVFPVVEKLHASNYTFEFHKNTKAYDLITITYSPTSSIYTSEAAFITELKNIKNEHKDLFKDGSNGRIRLKFQVPSNVSQQFRDTIKSVLFDEKNISTTIKEIDNESTKDSEEDEDSEDDFILDVSLPIIDKIYQYAEKNYERKITMEKLNNYLAKSLAQISAKKKLEEDEGDI